VLEQAFYSRKKGNKVFLALSLNLQSLQKSTKKVSKSVRFIMFLKEVSNAHHSCIYLIKSTVITVTL